MRRLMVALVVALAVAVLALGSVVGAQKLQTKGTGISMADNDSIQELTEAISARLVAQWDGWKNQDAASNNAIIADDFTSFWPDGSRHRGKPTAQQMAEQPIAGYKLSEFRVVPVAADAALVTYFAEVKIPGDNEHQKEFRMAVGEVWVKRNGQWVIRGYSGTLMK
jgi:ketosteroid isomerase-like protein